ncbi:MAG TPA: hypothetical protein VNM40_03370 [Candidatus Paceibacterota bacterium]|nr:hypothetical protein [Candidatus Paceibacterota bacterium]
MKNTRLFILQALVVALIAAVHITALQWSLYWHYVWLDVPVHFAGGLWIALITSWFLLRTRTTAEMKTVFAVVILVSVAWEIFELAAGVPIEENFALDTSIDLTMDILGGLCGFFVAHKVADANRMVQSDTNGSPQNNPS